MVYEDIAVNKRNTFILLFSFSLIITGLGYGLGVIYGDPYTGVIIGFAISVFSIWTSYFNSAGIVLGVTGAKPADIKFYRKLHDLVEGMSLAAGLRKPRVYVMKNDSINAFATGRNPSNSAIAVTTGALEKLSKEELEGVIAHEMSHIKNYDILVSSVSAVLVGTIIMLSDMIKRSTYRSSFGRARGRQGAFMLVIVIIAAILAPFAAMVINFAVSRQREYLADAQSVLLTRYPQGLIGALKKIKEDKPSMSRGNYNSSVEHMYFSSPSFLKKDVMFSTHPPLEKRIARLDRSVYY